MAAYLPTTSAGPSIPFEDRSLPFVDRLARTIWLAVSDPWRLFSAVPDGEIGPPLLYGTVIGTAALLMAILWQTFFELAFALALRSEAGTLPILPGRHLGLVLASPLLAAIALLVGAGMSHLALWMLDDGGRGFGVTLRLVAYGNTPQLLGVIPVCGGLMGSIWSIVLYVFGATRSHETEWWRALLTCALPAILGSCVMLSWFSSPLFMFAGLLDK